MLADGNLTIRRSKDGTVGVWSGEKKTDAEYESMEKMHHRERERAKNLPQEGSPERARFEENEELKVQKVLAKVKQHSPPQHK